MKLDRHITNQRRGKYALIKLRETTLGPMDKTIAGTEKLMLTVAPNAVDFGDTDDSEFFVIRLRDKYAAVALHAYAQAAVIDDTEYAEEIADLARKAQSHPNKKRPD